MGFSNHSLILKNDGTLWGCGYNGSGELGLGDTINRNTFTQITTNTDNIKQIYCGNGHTIILKDDGTLWGCGLNNHGQLGLGDTNNRSVPTLIPDLNNVKEITYIDIILKYCMRKNGTDFIYKNNAHIELNDIENLYEFGIKSINEICKQYLEKEKNNDIKIKKLIKEEE